jgi:hypothetical protein
MAEPLVFLRHCVGVDGQTYCAPGLRAFCRRHGLSLRQLAREGIPVSKAEATGDAMALHAAARARLEHEEARNGAP